MKSRTILTLVLICCAWTAIAGENETATTKKKVVHHVQFMVGNYASLAAAKDGLSPAVSNPYYSYSVGFEYKAEFSQRIGLRTGLNYFTYGYGLSEISGENVLPYSYWLFASSLHVPLDLMVFKNLKKGRLVFTAGPDLYFPTNIFGKNPWGVVIHERTRMSDFKTDNSLGFTVGLGYEKKLTKGLAVEFMPDLRVLNLLPFGRQDNDAHTSAPYLSYNMALGLSTYITFY